MKTLRLGVGAERPNPHTLRIMVDIGLDSSKPANEKVRMLVASILTIAAFLAVVALKATDVPDTEPTAIITEVSPWR